MSLDQLGSIHIVDRRAVEGEVSNLTNTFCYCPANAIQLIEEIFFRTNLHILRRPVLYFLPALITFQQSAYTDEHQETFLQQRISAQTTRNTDISHLRVLEDHLARYPHSYHHHI